MIDYRAIAPELILGGTILLVLVVDAFLPERFKQVAMGLSLVGVIAALAAVISMVGGPVRETFGGSFVVDRFTLLFQGFFLVAAIVVLALSLRYVREGGLFQGEYYFLLLTALLGCVLMPASRNLLLLFIALELVSAPSFIMAALRKGDVRSSEGALKFFIVGVLSTAVTLYGMSMIYGLTGGKLQLTEVAAGLSGLTGGQETLAMVSILFVIAGFAFKVSAVPFQFWAPDAYEGSPVPVAAFLAVASKVAGFAGLLQLMFIAFIGQNEMWVPIFAILSIATMTLGNLVALQQKQVVRLLAYSGIAQAGYILLPFALVTSNQATNASAFSAATMYILIYGVMNLGAFAVVVAVSRSKPRLLISDFAGLMKVAPVLAIGMTVFMISLAGVPPTGGFWGKLFIFRAAIDRGGSLGIWLAIIMLVNSVISVGYYFLVPREMIFRAPDGEPTSRTRSPLLVTATVAVLTAAILIIFVVPGTLARLADLSTLVGG
jgi:NADH-quinone oxidoreductase subunit N